jgi:hypothetical protein
LINGGLNGFSSGKITKISWDNAKNPGHVTADLVVVDDVTLQHLGQLSNLRTVGVERLLGGADPQGSRLFGRAVSWGPGSDLQKIYKNINQS